MLIGVLSGSLHLLVPHAHLLDGLGRENQRRGGQLARVVLEQRGVEKRNLLNVLSEVENSVFVAHKCRHLSEALKEAIGGRACNIELKSLQDLLFHLQYFWLLELVLRNSEQVFELGRVDLLVLGRDQERGDAQDVQLALLDLL